MSTQAGGKRKLLSVGYYRFTGKTLGKGNFAKVEEAVHSLLNVKVAIKIMDINQIKEDYVVRNLCREAKIMLKLNHPCIAALYQTMQRSDNVYYLVTELVAGGDLCSYVKNQRNGRLDERSTRIYGRQFASALSHMHELGVVHRDLKMENVMLNNTQTQIKIVDFGLSNVWSPNNLLKTHCGSPEYAAPELFVTGKQYGAEVDLWSLGIILYGMVLGQLPFIANRVENVTSQERRRRLVAQINRGLSTTHRRALSPFSQEFRNLMSRLLVADATKRITVKELIVHPWITEKGRKHVKGNLLKQLDSFWHGKVVDEISAVLQIDKLEVSASITHEPLGKIGGMYNILTHQHQLRHMPIDGIMRNISSLTYLDLPNYSNEIIVKNNIPKFDVTNVRTATKKPHTAIGTRNKGEYYVSKEVLANEYKSSKVVPSKNDPVVSSKRPVTVHQTTGGTQRNRKDPDMKIKSPAIKRKVYSAVLSQKCSRSKTTEESLQGKAVKKTYVPVEIKRVLGNDSSKDPTKDSYSNGMKRMSAIKNKMNEEMKIKESPFLIKTPVPLDKQRCKSEHSHSKRETLAAQQLKLKKLQERNEKLTVTNSASKSLQKPSTTTGSRYSGTSKCVFSKPTIPWEKSIYAYGDPPVRAVTAPSKQGNKRYQIYDPIAKCIADYVVNNVPDKLHNFPWNKK